MGFFLGGGAPRGPGSPPTPHWVSSPPPSRSASLWLEAHDDPLAGLRSFPACMGELVGEALGGGHLWVRGCSDAWGYPPP